MVKFSDIKNQAVDQSQRDKLIVPELKGAGANLNVGNAAVVATLAQEHRVKTKATQQEYCKGEIICKKDVACYDSCISYGVRELGQLDKSLPETKKLIENEIRVGEEMQRKALAGLDDLIKINDLLKKNVMVGVECREEMKSIHGLPKAEQEAALKQIASKYSDSVKEYDEFLSSRQEKNAA